MRWTKVNFIFFIITALILIIYATIILLDTKKAYDAKKVLPRWLALSWSLMYLSGLFLLILLNIWILPIDLIISVILDSILIRIGVAILFISMVQLKSISRSFGRDNTQLITTRIYRWSRNPQNLGCFFIIFGTALIVRSLISFILAVIYLIVIHFYIAYMEEKYLEKLFEKEYSIYKRKTPRYIGRLNQIKKWC